MMNNASSINHQPLAISHQPSAISHHQPKYEIAPARM
jgi:hypothetical protein